MDKYRRVNKPREKAPDYEIRVTANTLMRSYLGYIAALFENKNERVIIKGTGLAISKAISLATLVRHKFKGLHQIIDVGSMDMVDEYEPIEEGLDKVVLKRKVPLVTITLSLKPLDENNPGYAAPLPESEVTQYQPFVPGAGMSRGRGFRRGRGGFGRGRFRGGRRFGGRFRGRGRFRGGGQQYREEGGYYEEEGQGEEYGYRGDYGYENAGYEGAYGPPRRRGWGRGRGRGMGRGRGRGRGMRRGGRGQGYGSEGAYY